jgi:protein involved in polysaccharide export with SLBB domain
VIRLGDVLKLDVHRIEWVKKGEEGEAWNATSMKSPDVRVDPSGSIRLGALYGRVKVAGLSIEEAEKAVVDAYQIALPLYGATEFRVQISRAAASQWTPAGTSYPNR